jgi:uncharacterized protein YggE
MNDKTSNAGHEQDPTAKAEEASGWSGVDRAAERHAGPVTVGRAIALTAAASLLVGIMVGPIMGGHPALAANPSTGTEHTVTVSGTGEISVAPDVADVVIGVMVQKPTVAEAQSAAATAMTSVLAAIKKDGVADKDITTVNLSLTPVYDYSSGGSAPKLVGQQFANTVQVTVRDLKSVASVVDDSTSAGATTIAGITFRLNDPKSVQAQARQLAMADARSKADALTFAANVSVTGVSTITETTAQTNPIYYGAALDAAKAQSVSTPIQTGTTDIVVQVTVSYLIG